MDINKAYEISIGQNALSAWHTSVSSCGDGIASHCIGVWPSLNTHNCSKNPAPHETSLKATRQGEKKRSGNMKDMDFFFSYIYYSILSSYTIILCSFNMSLNSSRSPTDPPTCNRLLIR